MNSPMLILWDWQISEEEITFLTGGDDPYDDSVVLNKLFHPNLKLLVVTEGSSGCRYYTKVQKLISLLFSYFALASLHLHAAVISYS